MYSYIYIYIYIYVSFEGVCLTTVILAPGASEGGLQAAGQVTLCPHNRIPGDEFREVICYAQASQMRAIGSELDAQVYDIF